MVTLSNVSFKLFSLLVYIKETTVNNNVMDIQNNRTQEHSSTISYVTSIYNRIQYATCSHSSPQGMKQLTVVVNSNHYIHLNMYH